MRTAVLLALVAAAIASGSATASVPTKVSFTARLVNEESGEVVTGPHRVKFELFDAASAGASVWLETRQFEIDEDGLLFADLGEVKALDGSVFDGRALWLQISLDDELMEPRVALASVPYAIRAGAATDAEKVGGKSAADLQARVTGTCATGSFLNAVNADGTVTCGAGATGTGDITDVLAGTGLQGGGTTGSVSLSLLQTCTMNQVLKWNGSAWACQQDSVGGGGDITAVTAGPGLVGGGASGDVAMSLLTTCGMAQVLKWNGSTWVCAIDVDTDTNSGGDITSVSTVASSGLVGGVNAGDAVLSLLTTCAAGQVLKWSGTAWACANDANTASGGDITDVLAGAGLTGGGTTGSVTLDIGAGDGITVAANTVSLDTGLTDDLYVNRLGDAMNGPLDMTNQRILRRGCPTGHVRIGPGLCTESSDELGFTFTGCASRCRLAGTHMCSSAEMRSIMTSGVTLGTSVQQDWVDDQNGDNTAIYINNTNAEDPDGVRATTTSSYCRCCANVE